MPPAKKSAARRTTTKKRATTAATKSRSKRPSGVKATRNPSLGKRTHAKQIKERLHGAIRRTPTVSEQELAETAAAVLTVVAELAAETALVFGEVLARIEAIERRLSR